MYSGVMGLIENSESMTESLHRCGGPPPASTATVDEYKGGKETQNSESGIENLNRTKKKKQAIEYSPEICEKLLRYFYSPKQKVVYDTENFQSGDLKRKKPVCFPPEYPTFDRFARQIGVTVPILYQWEKQYPEFAEACDEAREAQKNCVIVNALNRNFDAGFSKFLLCKKFPEEFSEGSEVPEGGLDIHITYGKESGDVIRK